MQFNVSISKKLIATVTLLCLWPGLLYAEKATRILIVSSANEEPYQNAITGFKNQLSKLNADYTELTLAQANGNNLDSIKPDLIYALGNEATQWAGHQTTNIPIIGNLVLNEAVLRQSANTTGISLSYSLKLQFQWLKKFFTGQKTVAILYSPTENTATLASAKSISQQEGFKLLPIAVETPKELPYALERLTNNVDVLLAIPDATVMSSNTAKEILLATFSNKVPLVGLSDNWVKSGALYALSWDYLDLGKQGAEMAEKVLRGTPVRSISTEYPRKVTYTINAKIADHMNIEISDSLRKNAKMSYD